MTFRKEKETNDLEAERSLSQRDTRVIEVTRNAIDHISKEHDASVVARFVVGWVCDHLIEIDNDDYDIEIEGIPARDFT